jgi:alkylation response protein AidB-like acyl-CoA dehydrogenase
VNLQLSDDQAMIQRTAREYAERELAPRAAERDRTGAFPEQELRALAALGLLGMTVPEQHGGSGVGAVAYTLALEELARADASVCVAVSVTNMVADFIATVGTEAQRQAWLPRLLRGDDVCASFALSEPQSGSDASALATTAVETADGGWRLSGTKQWITSGDRAGVILVFARTGPGEGNRGISAFLVRRGTPGLTVARLEDKMGLHGSSTAQLVLDGVELPADALIGERGGGFSLALRTLEGGRIAIAAQAIGIARGALELAVRYAKERQQFGVPLSDHQAIGNMLADAATSIEAARLMTLRAAWRRDSGQRVTKEAAMAKLFATERAVRACDVAIQVHGGYGYTRDFAVERMYRDVRVTTIYEGTSEIQRIVIARQLMREAGLVG